MDRNGRISFRWPLYLCGQESLRKKGVGLHNQQKSLKCSTLVKFQKRENDFGSFPRQTIQHNSIQVYAPTTKCQRSWSCMVLWRPSRTNTKKKKQCAFHHRGLECKNRKSRDTWSNRPNLPWSTKWSRAKANRVLLGEHTGHSKHPFPTKQEMTLHMESSDGQYSNQADYCLCSQWWRSSMHAQSLSCFWLFCYPMDCSPPGFSIAVSEFSSCGLQGIERRLSSCGAWASVAPWHVESPQTKDWTHVPWTGEQDSYSLCHQRSPLRLCFENNSNNNLKFVGRQSWYGCSFFCLFDSYSKNTIQILHYKDLYFYKEI